MPQERFATNRPGAPREVAQLCEIPQISVFFGQNVSYRPSGPFPMGELSRPRAVSRRFGWGEISLRGAVFSKSVIWIVDCADQLYYRVGTVTQCSMGLRAAFAAVPPVRDAMFELR